MNKAIPEIDYKVLDKIQDVLVLGASNRFDKKGGIIDKQSRLIYEYIYNNYINSNFQSEKPSKDIIEIAETLEKEVEIKTIMTNEEFAKKYKLKQYKPKTNTKKIKQTGSHLFKKTKIQPETMKEQEIIEPIISEREVNE
jgi:hypothetical protein